jgi:predicted nucleic acid-binding protein
MRLIIDANVLVSAYTCDGVIRQLWLDDIGLHSLYISPEIFSEVERTLRKSEFNLSSEEIRSILHNILDRCEVVRILTKSTKQLPDIEDAHLADLADTISVDAIVTGDDKIRELGNIGATKILSPAELKKLGI